MSALLRRPAPLPTEPRSPRARLLQDAVAASLIGTRELPEERRLRLRAGELPERLRGALYRNGPGQFRMGADHYRHLFDGDGLVTRLRVDEDGVHYRSRFVRTRAFEEERAASRMLYRAYGTNPPGGPLHAALRLRFKNAANTSVVRHGDHLFALWEGGLPHALDPETLETLGAHDFDGALRVSSFASRVLGTEPPFCAHPQHDRQTGDLWAFGMEPGIRGKLHVYRVDPEGALTVHRSVTLAGTTFVHDFALTERYCVFLLSSVRVDLPRMASGLSTLLDAIEPTGDGVRPLLVPRDGGPPVLGAPLPPGFVYHLVNAFESGGQVVVDALWLDGFVPSHFGLEAGSALRQGEIPPARLRRVWIDPAGSRSLSRTMVAEPAELPAIHPAYAGRRARQGWLVVAAPGRDVYTGIGRVDLETGQVRRRDLWPLIPGEPVRCPDPEDPSELAGWVLIVCTHATERRSVLAVLDANTLETTASADLPQLLPPGFHGAWQGTRVADQPAGRGRRRADHALRRPRASGPQRSDSATCMVGAVGWS